ncbi:MAG: methionyl-tRNA formyltransferase [Patescibacteria group bacterium]
MLYKKESKKYNIIFVGTPEYSVPTLEALMIDERFNVAAIITAPDAPVGRKQILTPPPVKIAAEKYGLKILQPLKLRGQDVAVQRLYDELRKFNPDVIITIAYGQIIPPAILTLPKFGCINLHASLLPKYRGASPIQAAITAGDDITGITLMKMDAGLDTGDIIAQTKLTIAADETGESLHDKLSILSANTLLEHLPNYLTGKIDPKPQNETLATYAPKLTRQSGRIDWQKPAADVERLVRAYYSWPGTWSKWEDKILKIISVDSKILPINKNKTGEIFLHDGQLTVQCGQNALIIKKLQLEGKQVADSADFLSGYKNIISNILK